jgi:site-specific recombinase XerD
MSSRSVTSLSYAARRELIERVAPLYQEASLAQKGLLLDRTVAVTGYARKYAIRLLNQTPQNQYTIHRRRRPRYGSEVRHALLLAWKAAKYICAKRLIPFLPTLVPALERHGYLQLTEESRSTLLQVSPTTADRVLHPHRTPAPRGFSLTQAGPLLKHQIPIRTFQQWNETQPGFVEADLVAHCGGHPEGSFFYTFTLTDVATGWTECLSLLSKSAEAVLFAFEQARALFPFPILGLDVDTGGEFINQHLMRYCGAEHITFTRGRPDLKADQCYVEQKNRAIVRTMVGHDRLIGEQAYRQLREVYRAVRLFINCFQPSMKLVSKSQEGGKVRRVYDAAKTPLQRLMLSGVLSAESLCQLDKVVQGLDPLRLLQLLQMLQQALWRCAVNAAPLTHGAPAASILYFCVERCQQGTLLPKKRTPVPISERHLAGELPAGVLDWPRTSRDPFEGQWERLLALVLAHPEWSGSDFFQEMQRLFPGRYHSSHQHTLQAGLRKIRARLFTLMQEPWPQEVIQGRVFTANSVNSDQPEQVADRDVQVVDLPPKTLSVHGLPKYVPPGQHPSPPLEVSRSAASGITTQRSGDQQSGDPDQTVSLADASRLQMEEQNARQVKHPALTIEQAIQWYLDEHKANERSPKTMEWHQTALGLFQQYLVNQRHLCLLGQITEVHARGWVAFLQTSPSAKDTTRASATIATYVRSARAFCHWGVRNGYLKRSPFVKGIIPQPGRKAIHPIEPDIFDRLLLACRPAGENAATLDHVAARNQSILWILMDTGMRVSELCGLCLWDVNHEQRSLRVQGRGKERWLTLSPNGWFQMLSYLEQSHSKEGFSAREQAQDAPLFFSERYQPLTINALSLLVDRLRKRAKISEEHITPSLLRDTFAVRYLQAGGDPEALRAVLGLTGMESVKRYERLSLRQIEQEPR